MTSSLLDEMREVTKQFFALPLEEKRKYVSPIDDFEGYGNDTFVAEDRILNWTDRLSLFRCLGLKSKVPLPSRFQFCPIPLDIAKVRLQLQKRSAISEGIGSSEYRVTFGTIATIAKEESLPALWKGIVPGLHRQFLYGGLRIGLYDPVKLLLVGGILTGDVSLFQKILAALLAGAIAIIIANPTDLVKARLQAEGKSRRYSGALDAYVTIFKQEGILGLWIGLGPNIARNAIVNAAELASYDHVKETILAIPGFTDNAFTHSLAGLGAGFFAVCIGSPVDVVSFFDSIVSMAGSNALFSDFGRSNAGEGMLGICSRGLNKQDMVFAGSSDGRSHTSEGSESLYLKSPDDGN
ncbi:hypothetical protein Droror1_Dr00023729 [Drosera rotundifolia]